MSFLETLTNAEKDTLVSLPYRAGLWVSQSDDAGGAESSALELQTLSNIINGFARDIFGAEMMQHVMAETLAQQERWPEWALKMDSVVDDCGRAVDLVRTHGDAKDVNAFVQSGTHHRIVHP